MKKHHYTLSLAFAVGLGCFIACSATAQTLTILHNFTNSPDGEEPAAGLVLSGNILYGTTETGGTNGADGTVFAVNTDGTDYTMLHSFDGSDGQGPEANLILSGNTLYGTTAYGGIGNGGSGPTGNGTVFAINTDGTGFTNLYSFSGFPYSADGDYNNSDGASPAAGLILSGNTLYGTAGGGGQFSDGTVFAVNADSTGFSVLHTFAWNAIYDNPADGVNPDGSLVLSGNTLYGTTRLGGTNYDGTVFEINTDHTGYLTLHNFNALDGGNERPQAGLVLSGNTLYGTTEGGNISPYQGGTVFAVNTDGSGFRTLHTFTGGTNDGYTPLAGLTLSGNTLYGTTSSGGFWGDGTVFAINTDGTDYTVFYSFNLNGSSPRAANPSGGLLLSGNVLYGTTTAGGSPPNFGGTVFSLTLPAPQLGIAFSSSNLTLNWPTIAQGYNLQSTTNLTPPVVWSPVLATTVATNGAYTVSIVPSGAQQYFRLAQ